MTQKFQLLGKKHHQLSQFQRQFVKGRKRAKLDLKSDILRLLVFLKLIETFFEFLIALH
jgi:hypothetical protein